MPEAVQVGTILMSEWPQLFELETASYSGPWSVVKGLDGFAIDRKIRAAGWSFFFIASEVKVMFLGAPGTKKMQHAVNRILGKVTEQHFNAIEVTGIVTKTFLGLRYAVVSAHPRHVQENCYLHGPEVRRLLMSGQNVRVPSRIFRQTSCEKGSSFPSVAD
ncbi:MAG: hypothetical protein ACLPHI_05130 [Terriglobales bacterium]|jgi:hypothetical protein